MTSPAPRTLLDDGPMRRHSLLPFAAVLLTLVLITSWFLVASWTEQMRNRRAELAETAQIVQVAVQNHLNRYSRGLAFLAAQIRSRGWLGHGDDDLAQALRDFRSTEPSVAELTVVDWDGSAPADLREVQALARAHPGSLQVGRPLLSGPARRALVPIAWAQAPAGGHAGFMVLGALDQKAENAMYRSLVQEGANPHLTFGVLESDGYLLGRWPLPQAEDLKAFYTERRTGLIMQALQHNPGRHWMPAEGTANADPSGRVYVGALHRLDGYSLVAFVVTPRSAVVADWWSRARLPLAGALLLALMVGVLLRRDLLLQRDWLGRLRLLLRSSEQARDEQRRDAGLFAQILDNLPGGLIVFNAAGLVQYCSAGFVRMTGITVPPRELLGKPWRAVWALIEHMHAGGRNSLNQVKILFNEHQPAVDEVWLKDGRIFLRHYTPLQGTDQESAGALWTIQDVTERKLQEQQIRELAERDSLTGLSNRGAFEKLLAETLERRDDVALGIADLDDFKAINDRFGHAAGDALLVEVAARLRGALRLSPQSRQGRDSDILARIGGDEFALLLPVGKDPRRAQRIAERVMAALRPPIEIEGQMLSARLSLGLALRIGNEDAQTLMRQADIALYAAKARGRNQACLFDQHMQAEVEARQGWLSAIERALEQGRLQMHVQPILSVPRQRNGLPAVNQVEGLLRLLDEDGRLHNAGKFEHVLDEPRVAVPVGRWVLEQAAHWIERWRARGVELGMSVNISPRHFLGPHFLDDLRELLGRHPRMRPGSLTLELTEHGALLDGDATRRRVEECHGLGVQVSLDDFGTGSASLTHLQALAVSTLKIERRFVKDLMHDARDLSIAYGILRTAQLMGVRVVAEGVETPELARVLVAMGCQHLQGYAVARPMPAAQLLEWLADWPQRLAWSADLGKPGGLGPDGIEAIVSVGTMLRQLMQGALDAETEALLRQPDAAMRCPIGQWCQHHAGRWRHQARFEDLVQRQSELYALVRRWLDEPLARPALEVELHMASDELRERFWALTLQGSPGGVFVLQPPEAT
ncbi:EAL domain-containing protein [Thiomonas sp. FB-6]|uniref:bifunctional diguanylate cyclase/phosphodiesterase n=1 Tax=Thiomonas sp. FB-6 TaxID=1158291 RepID=UPI000370DB74|nr:EAL domain-containing protein [Thiomonas sp. FB-6]